MDSLGRSFRQVTSGNSLPERLLGLIAALKFFPTNTLVKFQRVL